MRRTLLFLLFSITLTRPMDAAQLPPLERLSPQNIHRIQQVGLMRQGTAEELAWSPDEAYVAVAGSGGARVYTLSTGEERLLLGHLGQVNDIDFRPDGQQIVTAGDDGSLRIWDAATANLLRTLEPYADLTCECTFRLTSAKYTADGTTIWVGAENGPMRSISVLNGETLAEAQRSVLEIVPDANRSRFAVTEQRSSRVSIWRPQSEFLPLYEIDMRFTVWNVSFEPESARLLVAGFVGARLAIVDTTTGETIDTVRGARVVHAGRGSYVTQVIEWIRDTRRISLRVSASTSDALQYGVSLPVELTDARFSPSGDLLAYADASGTLRVVHWRYSIELLNVPPRGTALVGLALLDNNTVASIDGGVGVVQSLTRAEVPAGGVVRMWEVRSGSDVGEFVTADYGLANADVLYWDSNIRRLIVGSTIQPDRQLEIDPQTGDVRTVDVYNIFLLADEQYGADHPDGLLRAEATSTDDVRLVDIADARNMTVLQSAGPSLAFTGDGLLLLTSGPSGAIRLWGVPAVVPAAD